MPVQSIHRAAAILDLFSDRQPCLGITEISRVLNLHKSTVASLVRSLEKEHFLEKDMETRKYRLGRKIYRLGTALVNTIEVNRQTADCMHQMSIDTGYTTRLSIWDDTAIQVTLEVDPGYRSIITHQIGPRVAAYCTSMGRVFLAALEPHEVQSYLDATELKALTPFTITEPAMLLEKLKEIKAQGYAVVSQEVVVGEDAVAAPIFRSNGIIAASLCISVPTKDFSTDKKDQIVTELLKTTLKINARMGYRSFSV